MAAGEEGSPLHMPTAEWLIAVIVGMVCVAMLVIYVVVTCTDCYKSEVSTECHPASAAGAPKWGGAGGYSAAAGFDVHDPVLGAGFTGEVIQLQDVASHALPYALVPSEVPEAQGFRGYGPAETADGVGGYGSTGAYQPSQAAYGGSSSVVGYGGSSSLAGYGSGSFAGYGGSNAPSGYGGVSSSLAGYGDGSAGSSAVPPTGYGGSGGTQSSISNAPARQASLTGYGATGAQPLAARATQGGTAQGEGRNTGAGGSSRPFPGAHVPLMTPEPEDPPPPYFTAAH